MDSQPDLSIIIPAFNEADILAETLGKIQAAIKGISSVEIIVCDNNSTDQTADIARQAGAVVVSEPVQQISRARNTGARVAKGNWFLFIDADTYPDEKLIKEVMVNIKENRMIGFGSTVKAIDGPLWARLRLERLNPSMRLFKWTGGAFLGCEAEAFHQIGGFSEGLYAYEEIEFVGRLKKYGRPTAEGLYHISSPSCIHLGEERRCVEFSYLDCFHTHSAALSTPSHHHASQLDEEDQPIPVGILVQAKAMKN